MSTGKKWSPTSWRGLPSSQQVEYENQEALEKVLSTVSLVPPIVHHYEIEHCKALLAEVANGERFLLTGGDCAELFQYCNEKDIENKLKVLIQMSLVLTYGARIPVLRMLRGAGQYAKPRSKPKEVIEGKEYDSFRGDNVNGFELSDRKPDPQRLLQSYFHSAATWNYVRALLSGKWADLHTPDNWKLDHIEQDHVSEEHKSSMADYQKMVDTILDSLDFMKTIKAQDSGATEGVELFCAHEGLLLNYESSLTRPYSPNKHQTSGDQQHQRHYNVGTHFLWIGDRTRQLGGAHLEYFRGLSNPIGK
eukprot:Lithocolla_globosa_v1_NODE_5312_length_1263_cov_6.668046.p1 type:complete len:306 gc:universal NODE_5312_length_1263_cov_6.668046:1084-167(-)